MTIAIISDIHGNYEALKAVLADISQRSADRIACLGDVVSFGPLPSESVGALSSIPGLVWIRGNHDRYIGEKAFSTEAFAARWPAGLSANELWTHSRLSRDQAAGLANLPPSATLPAEGITIRLFHATQTSDEDFLWADSTVREFEDKLGRGGIRVYGHIHHQYSRRINGTVYVNPGSVGFPFDGSARAAYALVHVETRSVSVELIRVDYDLGRTLAELQRHDVPWIGPIRSALRESLSFFSSEVKALNDHHDYEIGGGRTNGAV